VTNSGNIRLVGVGNLGGVLTCSGTTGEEACSSGGKNFDDGVDRVDRIEIGGVITFGVGGSMKVTGLSTGGADTILGNSKLFLGS
jgi:hypothetical protein